MIFFAIQLLSIFSGLLAFLILPLSLDERIYLLSLLSALPVSLKLFLDYSNLRRKENEFTTFLRDLTLNIKTGMSITKAIEVTARGRYTALRKDLDSMMKNISLGMPVEKAFEAFGKEQKTRNIKRAVSVISTASRSGGKIGDVLSLLTSELLRVRANRAEMEASLHVYTASLYVIYLTYLTIAILSLTKLLPSMASADINVDLPYYDQLLFRSSMIIAVFSGLIAGKMGHGSIHAGSIHAILMSLICFLSFIVV